ncbi:fungal-specific transcription factor domain-containing protein [Pseudomassariella vexata]|uniref:Fungal-specific transcription factor domain-domain-containing protein n=1 Tax=Pseudomassariella vexata TaxID=1141098 RepID=A0A1Y2DSM2_9PEZI|nr:fungal-specific transcription factor domain-containing protein [Pseudomassariella vexata]ORY62262.1 fungal-specific transcription factor domain-domain-containing protein [Pseudomassariella vexata]
MPRPKKPGAPEPKRRSRNGCWPCKNRKIKCGEEHPSCLNCQRAGEACDYSIRLNWEGRKGKRPEPATIDFVSDAPSSTVPSRGFQLVHQFQPGSKLAAGRKLEPLGPMKESSKSEGISSVSTSAPVEAGSSTADSPSDSFQRPSKRFKVSTASSTAGSSEKRPVSSPASTVDSGASVYRFAGSVVSSIPSPLTPAASSTYSDEDGRQVCISDPQSTLTPELRRLSVHSLLSGPPGPRASLEDCTSQSYYPSASIDTHISYSTEPQYYGMDRGLPDLDLGKNDDENAISTVTSPFATCDRLDTPLDYFDDDLFSAEFAFGLETYDTTLDTGGYYDKPVPIYIPHYLQPLPPKLLHNPMNLLYFHHFINHTASCLVPYDDPHANPFRITLPEMAVKNENLLALILAYSASHRARVLKQKEPELRIASWVTDIFPALRQALSDPKKNFSNANLATVIMLVSLEIASPKAFGYGIPWQKHLNLAKELITARPGGLHYETNFRQNQACSFLWSWAAYLDVIGSLSGGLKDSSTAWMFDYEIEDMNDGFDEIDCIMGFTTRCIYLLAKIADLARQCATERLGADNIVRTDWKPNAEVAEQALKLEEGIIDSMNQPPRPCKHIHMKGNLEKWGRVELTATNEAFHWAALVHLYRRILGRPSEDKGVQHAVRMIIACFDRIRRGGTAEACLLFPMFTAGCDAKEERQRALILERFAAGEMHGMTTIHRSRRLMEKVWETGQPWETVLSTEFIG